MQIAIFALVLLGAQTALAQQSQVTFTAAGDYKETPEATSVLQGIADARHQLFRS